MYDVMIVGGGPAGQSAAVFTSKGGKQTLVLDDEKGLTKLALVKNHYGTKDDVEGGDMVSTGREKAERFGAAFQNATATNIKKSGDTFEVETKEGDTYEASYVILTTGANQQLSKTAGLETTKGNEPYINEIIDVDEAGQTSVKGIWAAGAAGGVSQHTIITSGDGARVAVNLLSELEGERHVDHDAL